MNDQAAASQLSKLPFLSCQDIACLLLHWLYTELVLEERIEKEATHNPSEKGKRASDTREVLASQNLLMLCIGAK